MEIKAVIKKTKPLDDKKNYSEINVRLAIGIGEKPTRQKLYQKAIRHQTKLCEREME